MNIYQQQILDHYHHPHNFGEPTDFTHGADAENLSCGDSIKFFLTLAENSNSVTAAHFTGEGCAISLAAASLLSDELLGQNAEQINSLDEKYMLDLLGIQLTTSRIKCAMLSLDAVKKALNAPVIQS